MSRAHETRLAALALASALSASTVLAHATAPTVSTAPVGESPELKTFGVHLIRNLKAAFTSKQNILPLAIGGGAIAVSSIWDDDAQRHIGREGGSTVSDIKDVLGSSALLGGIAGGTLLVGYTSEHHKLRRVGYDLSQSFLLVQGMTHAVKYAVGRERPDKKDDLSFPSGHWSGAFVTAVVISHHYPKASISAYLAASFVAASRKARNKHWLSDVVAGATIGIIILWI